VYLNQAPESLPGRIVGSSESSPAGVLSFSNTPTSRLGGSPRAPILNQAVRKMPEEGLEPPTRMMIRLGSGVVCRRVGYLALRQGIRPQRSGRVVRGRVGDVCILFAPSPWQGRLGATRSDGPDSRACWRCGRAARRASIARRPSHRRERDKRHRRQSAVRGRA
jgi:hypothetical protein